MASARRLFVVVDETAIGESKVYIYSTKKRASRASALRADEVTVRVDF